MYIYTSASPRVSILVLGDTESGQSEFSGAESSSNSFFKWFLSSSSFEDTVTKELGHKSQAEKLGLDLEVASSSSPVDLEMALRLGVEPSRVLLIAN